MQNNEGIKHRIFFPSRATQLHFALEKYGKNFLFCLVSGFWFFSFLLIKKMFRKLGEKRYVTSFSRFGKLLFNTKNSEGLLI